MFDLNVDAMVDLGFGVALISEGLLISVSVAFVSEGHLISVSGV